MQLVTVRSPEPVGGKWLPPQAREPRQTIIPAGPKPRQGKTVEGRTQGAMLPRSPCDVSIVLEVKGGGFSTADEGHQTHRRRQTSLGGSLSSDQTHPITGEPIPRLRSTSLGGSLFSDQMHPVTGEPIPRSRSTRLGGSLCRDRRCPITGEPIPRSSSRSRQRRSREGGQGYRRKESAVAAFRFAHLRRRRRLCIRWRREGPSVSPGLWPERWGPSPAGTAELPPAWP